MHTTRNENVGEGAGAGRGDWRAVMLTVSGLSALTGVLCSIFLVPSKPPTTDQSATSKTSGKLGYWAVIRLPGITSLALTYVLVKLPRSMLMFNLAYYLETEVHMSRPASAMVASLFDVAGVFGNIVAGALADRVLGGRSILTACIFSSLAGVWMLGFCSFASTGVFHLQALSIGVAGFLIAAVDSMIGGSGARAITDCSAEARADPNAPKTATGVVNGLASLVVVSQQYLAHYVTTYYSWAMLFRILALMLITAAAVVTVAVRVEKKGLEWLRQNKIK